MDGHLALACYGLVPFRRITDVLSQVERWTGFTSHFAHVCTGLPPGDERTFLAALIAEATNLGLSRMAEVCNVAPRRAHDAHADLAHARGDVPRRADVGLVRRPRTGIG